ncbi:MAG: hypothetical protein R3A13_05235 [Bdellovibrionota bacterium]
MAKTAHSKKTVRQVAEEMQLLPKADRRCAGSS